MYRFHLSTPKRQCMLPIDTLVEEAVRTSGVKEGIAMVFIPHTTAAVTINENADPDVQHDILLWLSHTISPRDDFHHREGNSDAHIKSVLTGSSVIVPISESKIQLGTWQSIFFCEFDGPRKREVWVQIIPPTWGVDDTTR
ncbi:secondary thiamine-phosphate synthase enzyme YjbQ [Thermospira aquatica]|uniref:Secondary thiamine-phosphate synthase enzyme YjbQ n=1 Tax=Thermospira aquatica TaxID=2828656 RepID=A0AAX3BB04_9SPIR|nr:secondary thiamine-phosphate synthase enzyme YjbQ [Thermospira aquatica]URA09189.1 secondary thiamine-phosphate synthase enzyme YjbQ [Thermospira aquatica]